MFQISAVFQLDYQRRDQLHAANADSGWKGNVPLSIAYGLF